MRILFYILLLPLLLCSACSIFCKNGNGDITQQNRNVQDFHAIEINGAFNVYLNKGNNTAIKTETDQNLHEFIETEVKNGRLILSTKECLSATETVKIFVTMQQIKQLIINGASDIICRDTFVTDKLFVKVNGAGDINILTRAGKITTEINGAGDIKLNGSADSLFVRINGTGDIKGFDLPVKRGIVKINGTGDAEISVINSLDVQIHGTGDVYYKGHNPVINSNITGTGSVIKKEKTDW